MINDKKWQAECDMRTLREAQEIMANKTRHAAAKKEAASHIKKLEAVTAKPATRVARIKK